MGKDTRFRINLNRKRFNSWETKTKVKIVIVSFAIMVSILLIVFIQNNVNFNKVEAIANASINEEIKNNIQNAESKNNEEFDNLEDIENTVQNNLPQDKIVSKSEENIDLLKEEPVYVEEAKKDEITFTVLGEIMMGGKVTENLDYHYSTAFKTIYNFTRYSDFTYAVFSTNITSLSKIENSRSKYLVTKDIRTALSTLGIDAVNIATDHIIDYQENIFKNTLDVLKNNNIYLAGIKDSTLYVESYGKKIAIVATASSYTGIKSTYDEYGISIYDINAIKSQINSAKENADVVIVDVHWGRDDEFLVTNEMKNIAHTAIDAGADLILGSNALGIYPIYTYKEVPIIYSTGYLMTDLDYNLAKMSYIWQFNINKDNKIDSLEMIPINIVDKSKTLDFRNANQELCSEFNTLTNSWNVQNGLDSIINEDGSITIKF